MDTSNANITYTVIPTTVTVTGGVDVKDPVISTQPTGATYTVGATATVLSVACSFPTADKDGTLSYQWYSNTANSTTAGTAIPGATNDSYTPSTANAGTTYYYCVVTNTLNGNTATATSNAVEVTVSQKALVDSMVTLSSATGEYNGGAHTPTVTVTDSSVVDPSHYDVTYKKGDDAVTEMKNAGAYKVVVTGKDTGNYSGSVEKDYTITAASIADYTPTLKMSAPTFSYTGSNLANTISGQVEIKKESATLTSADYTLAFYTNSECTDTAGTLTNAGTYYFKATGTGNYAGTTSAAGSVVIGKASNGWFAEPAANTLTYTGEQQALVTAGKTSVDSTVQYKLGSDGTYGETIPTGTNAGEYTVYYKVVGNENYNDVAEQSVSVTIAKANIIPTVTMNDWVFGNAASEPTVNGNTGNGEVTYQYYTNEGCTTKTTTASGAAAEGGKPTKVGTYWVQATIAGTDNYNGATAQTSFEIKKTPATLTTAPTAMENLTYNKTAQALVTAEGAQLSGGTLVYQIGVDDKTPPQSGTIWSEDIPTRTNAGTYYVWCMVSGDADHSDSAPQCVTVTIAKKSVTASVATVEAKTYDGNTTGEGTLSLSGVENGDVVTASGTFTWVSKAAGTANIGVTDITLDGAAEDNYTLSATSIEAAAAPNNLEIAKKAVTLTWSTNKTLTYNGEEQTYAGATVDGAVSGETLGVTYSETNKATQTNAGDYTAQVTGLSGSTASNYEIASTATKNQAWKINPLPVQVKWFVGATDTEYRSSMPFVDADYDLPTPKAYGADGNEVSSSVVVLEIKSLTKGGASVSAVNAVGTYAATASVTSSFTADNYTFTNGDLSFSVEKANVTITWKIDNEAINTAGYAFDLAGHTVTFDVTCPGVTDEAILNKLKANFVIGEFKVGDQNAATLDGSTDTSKKVNAVGTYTATIGAAEGKSLDNFNITGNTATFTINPKQVGVKWVVKQGSADATTNASGEYPFIEDAGGYTVTAVAVESNGTTPVNGVTLTVKKGTDAATTNATIKDVANYAFEVGELAATAQGDAASNYQLPSNKGATTIKIVPAQVTVTWKLDSEDKTSSTYNGSEQTVTAVVMNGETDVSSKFKFTDEAGVSKAVTNAGKYSFKVEAKEDADKTNYTLPTNATQEITIEKADRTLTATFDGKIKGVDATGSITLAVTSTAAGSGVETDAQNCDLTVTASPTGIVALPNADKFNASYQVTGKKTGATELTFSLAASDNYEAATAKLKVTVDAGYTITVGGITGGSVKPDVTAAAKGTDVTLTVTPSTGYVISSVSYTPEGGSAQTVELADDVYKFTMPENDVTVNATFTKKSSEVAIAGGLPDDVTLEATGGVASNKAEYGATVTVTVSGDKKGNVTKVFWYKTGDTSNTKYDLTKGTDNTYTFQMPDYAVTVGAEAKTPVTLTVTTPAAADGTLSTSPAAGTILPGTEVTVTATPASGKTSGGVTFVKTGDSSAAPEKATPTTTTNNYTFTMPEYDVTVSASFVSTSDINNAASAVEENSVKTGKVDGETEVATSAVESQVDAETLEDIKTAAAKVDVTNDVAVKAEATAPNAAGDKADAVQKLAEAGLVTVDTSGGSTPVVKNGNETATIRIINKVFLDVEVKAFTESGDNMSMKLDIKPMQQKIATVASESTALNENNTVPLGAKSEVTGLENKSVTLSIGIPQVMANKAQEEGGRKFVFIKHTKGTGENAKVYLHKVFLNGLIATFTNTHGFSDFEVELQDSSVASYKYSDTETRYFTTFEAAVADALAKGKTAVTLHKNPENTDKADISEAVDLTVSKASGAVSITYSELYENNFTLGAKIGRGSTAADINDGKLKFAAKYTVTISGDDSVAVGSTLTLTATVEDALGKNVDASSVTWTSSNTDVATVANDGKVTGVAAGNVTITATYTDSGQNYTATKPITVTAANGGGTTTTGGSGGGTVTAPVSMASGVRNGSVSFSNANAKAGEKVTVTPKPNNGYVTDSIVVKDDKGNEIPVTKNADGTFTFTMPASGKVTVTPTFVEESKPSASKFIDVDSGAYYADAVEWAVENGVTTGMSDATFAPEASCTRGQMVTFLWRAVGMPEPKSMNTDFADLGGTDAYYYKAVLWAVEQGITNGTGANRFSPDAIVNRGQVVTFLYRYEKASADARSAFADVNSSAYYAAAVNWAVVNGVTNGTGANKFSPDANCTRGQIVTFLYRDFVK